MISLIQKFIFLSILFLISTNEACEERLYWDDAFPTPRLISRTREDSNGDVILCHSYYYDAEGRVSREILFGNLSGECPVPLKIGEDSYPVMNGIESYSKTYIYSEDDPSLILEQLEEISSSIRDRSNETPDSYSESDEVGLKGYQSIKTTFQYDSTSRRCAAVIKEYQQQIIFRGFYFYDDDGNLEMIVSDEGEERIEKGPSGFNQSLMICSLKEESGVEEAFSTEVLLESLSTHRIWSSLIDNLYYCFRSLRSVIFKTRKKWKEDFKLPPHISGELRKIAKGLFGELNYLLLGFDGENTEVDIHGNGEINDKVRVTFINGILNTHSVLKDSLDFISSTHGGVNVHYVFRPTKGWTSDVSRAILIKTGYSLRFRSGHAHLLAKLWKSLIAEMGGVEGGGVIVHYAHSLGGTDTDRARDLLTPEQQKMIRVVTLGSATMVRSGGFQSVVNLVSINDGVSFFVEPFGNIRNYFDPKTNVHFHGLRFSFPYFPIDHSFNGATYGPLMRKMGEKFLAEFSNPQPP